jgi:hypothetical protein
MSILSRPKVQADDDFLNKLIKYIPAEITAAYLLIKGIIAQQLDLAKPITPDMLDWFKFTFFGLLIVTPIWIYVGVSSGTQVPPKPQRIFHAIVAEFAIVLWIYNISIEWTSELFRITPSPAAGSILLVFFTLMVPMLEKIFVKPPAATATRSVCDSNPAWPPAPDLSEDPLAIMQWANGLTKDKFGCTRTDATGAKKLHAGIDIKAAVGTDCFAVEDGKVEECGYGTDLGKYVSLSFIKSGKTYGVAYCHLDDNTIVKKGDSVKAGDRVGKTGKTGNVGTDATHLHFEVQNQIWVAYANETDRAKPALDPNGYI